MPSCAAFNLAPIVASLPLMARSIERSSTADGVLTGIASAHSVSFAHPSPLRHLARQVGLLLHSRMFVFRFTRLCSGTHAWVSRLDG